MIILKQKGLVKGKEYYRAVQLHDNGSHESIGFGYTRIKAIKDCIEDMIFIRNN